MYSVEECWEKYVKFTLNEVPTAELENLKRVYFSGCAVVVNMLNTMADENMDTISAMRIMAGIEDEIVIYEQKCNHDTDMVINNPTGVTH